DNGTTCGVDYSVSSDGFVRAPAHNACWHGYGFSGGDSGSIVDPTDFSLCGPGCVLSITGTVNASNLENAFAGYVFVGFGLNQLLGATGKGVITPTGTGIEISYQVSGPDVG